jgi:molybdenum cofactor biosynthesis enzyme MoaA
MHNTFPSAINLEFTNRCNLKCSFCLNNKPDFREHGEISQDLIDIIINELPKSTKIIICGIGEPTLHAQFDTFIDKLSLNFDEIELVTNGQFNKDIAKIICNTKIKKITFSLDYFDKEEYRKIKNGNLDKVIENILYVLNHKRVDSVIQINMLVEQNKINQIKNVISFLNKFMTCNDFIYSRNIKSLAGQVNVDTIKNENWLELENLKNTISKDVDVSKYRVENWIKFLNLDEAPKKRCACRHPNIYTMILWNGQLTFCCIDFNATMIAGDMNKNTIAEIWNGENYNEFRNDMKTFNFKNHELCKNCDEWYKQK